MGEPINLKQSDGAVLAGEGIALAAPLRQWPAMAMAAVVFAFLSLMAAIYSDGFLEADACTHYLYSRFCLASGQHHLLTNVWGRPFCTAIYAIPALIGQRLGVRATSMLISLAIGWISYAVAKRQGYRWPGLALIFVLGQPLLFLHSFSEMTELPFALLVALALWAYQGRQWLLLTLLVGIMPTARPEGFGFIALAAVALLFHGRWRWLPLLMVPLALWSVAGWYQFGMAQPWYVKWWHWLPGQWPYGDSVYDRGWLTHFVQRMPAVVSPGAFPAVVLGVWLCLRPSRPGTLLNSFLTDHRRRCQMIIALLPLGVLVGHSLLYCLGKMSSNGELRYMLVVAPMWALLAATGWEWAFARLNWRSPLGWAGVAVLVPALVNGVYRVVPINPSAEGRRAKVVAQWWRTSAWQTTYPRLITTCRDVNYYLDLSPNDPQRSAEWHPKTIEHDHRGIILVWDPVYGLFNSNAELKMGVDRIMANGWIPVHVFVDPPRAAKRKSAVNQVAGIFDQKDIVKEWIVFLSPQDAAGRPTPRNLSVPLPTTQPVK